MPDKPGFIAHGILIFLPEDDKNMTAEEIKLYREAHRNENLEESQYYNEIDQKADEISRYYLDSFVIQMRNFGAVPADTSTKILGVDVKMPVMTGALGNLDIYCRPDGIEQCAEGVKAAGLIQWIGFTTDGELEACAKVGVPFIKSVKSYKDIGMMIDEIQRTVDAGAIAVATDIDNVFDNDGYTGHLFGLEFSPRTLDELAKIIESCKVPFIAKGVGGAYDAKIALEIGCGGVVVSNHRGTIPSAMPTLMALPEVVETIGGSIPVFLDSNVREPEDAFKALALGADAVMIARPLFELVPQGADAIKKYFGRFNDHLRGIMSRTGVSDVSKFEPSMIRRYR